MSKRENRRKLEEALVAARLPRPDGEEGSDEVVVDEDAPQLFMEVKSSDRGQKREGSFFPFDIEAKFKTEEADKQEKGNKQEKGKSK